MMISLLAPAVAAIVIQLAVFKRMIRRRGLDPSLITYANPLAASNFRAGRALFASAAALSYLRLGSGRLLWTFILVSALFQFIILLVFNRQHTQPAGYFIIVSAAALAGLISGRPDRLILVIALIAAAEMYKAGWNAKRQERYDDWIRRTALKIHGRFSGMADELEPSHWSWVLHIAVTEHIARPAVVRLAERIYFRLRKPAVISTGIMQVAGAHPMSDSESISAGAKKIIDILDRMPAGLAPGDQLRWLAKEYNGSYAYAVYLNLTENGVKRALDEIG